MRLPRWLATPEKRANPSRKLQGCTPAMLVHDSRILQVTLFGMLRRKLSALDFSLLLPDVMTIADEVDSRLTLAMASQTNVAGT